MSLNNWSGHQVRKKANKKAVFKNIVHGFYFLSIQIYYVRKRLESKKRNAYRKDQLIYAKSCAEISVAEMRKMIEKFKVCAKDLVRAFCEKIGVLKISQQQQVDTYATGNGQFSYAVFFCAVNKLPPAIIATNGKEQKHNKHAACFVIKKEAY